MPRMKEHEEELRFRTVLPGAGQDVLPKDIDSGEYRVRFTGRIAGGYRVNVFRSDGTEVARGVKLRRWVWARTVEDAANDNKVMLKLSFNAPPALVMTILGDGELGMESVRTGIEDLGCSGLDWRMNGGYLRGEIGSAGLDISDALSALSTALSDIDKRVRTNAAWALSMAAEQGTDIAPAVPALWGATEDKCPEARQNAAAALMRHFSNRGDNEGIRCVLCHPLDDVRKFAAGMLN